MNIEVTNPERPEVILSSDKVRRLAQSTRNPNTLVTDYLFAQLRGVGVTLDECLTLANRIVQGALFINVDRERGRRVLMIDGKQVHSRSHNIYFV